MQTLKGAGAILAGVLVLVAFVFIAALYIAGLAWVSENVHEYLDVAAIIAFIICAFVLLPCTFFRATQRLSVYGFYISSVIFGASTWIFGFLATLQYWGVIGVFAGVIMGVVGIVPLGILASAFHSDWLATGQLALGLVLTYGARMTAVLLAARIDRDETGIKSNSWVHRETRSPQATSTVPEWVVLSAIGIAAFAAPVVFLYFTQVPGSSQPNSYSAPVAANERRQVDQTAAGAFEDAIAAFNSGDYATALRLFRPLAEQGNAGAQYNLGQLYLNGQGVPQDYSEAVKWFRLAAEQGHARAQNNLGANYWYGHGVPQNYVEAARWYRKAAIQGHAPGQFSLGTMYIEGDGVQQSYSEAMKWYRLAANQGYAAAQFGLGGIFYFGFGVPQDYSEAVKWFRLAAEQGNVGAQYSLGAMYGNGQAVPKNYVNALMWLKLAAAQGYQDAEKYRDLIEQRMTPAQIADAQKLARDWNSHSAPH